MVDELIPPRKSVELEDPGAHNVTDSSDESSDRFTDASEGHKRSHSRGSERSPVPTTRVERLDDEPAHGEIPGTAAYNMRAQDAVPDEVEIITRSRATSRVNPSDRPTTPLELQVPRMIVEKIDPDEPSYGDVPGTEAYEKRRADAVPDAVIRSPIVGSPGNSPFSGSPTASIYRSTGEASHPESEHGSIKGKKSADAPTDVTSEDEDGFGDDFDEFEEGQEADDFGEFDDGFQQQESDAGELSTEDSPSLPAVASTYPSVPALDWSEIDSLQDLQAALEPYALKLFPNAELASQLQAPSSPSQTFLSDRSLSLYSQLVAPPPLAPPNWLRSRIRRLFLVSLGVPVDLDEILPASKQKKLVLPSMNLPVSDRSPRHSTDSRSGMNGAVARLKHNDSNASLDSSGNKKPSKRRKEEAQQPRFDMSEAVQAGSTTDVKLEGLSDDELKSHVQRLKSLEERAKEVLGYWELQRESAIKEKEAFEGVIENLVKHARKVRK